ncbi:hypothetical protein OB08_10340 [Microbacterium sp. HJ5]
MKGGQSYKIITRHGKSIAIPMKGDSEAKGAIRDRTTGRMVPVAMPVGSQRAPQIVGFQGSIYLDTEDAFMAVDALIAFERFLRDAGTERLEWIDVRPGSVLVKFQQWAKRIADKRKVRLLATQLLGAGEAWAAERPQAENTAMHAKSAADLAEKTKHMKSFSFDSGPLQYVQWTDDNGETHGRARVLGSKQVASNRLSEEILSDPKQMFELLEGKDGVIEAPQDER